MEGRLSSVLLLLTALVVAPSATGGSLWPSSPECVRPVDEAGWVVQACVGGSVCYGAGGQTHVFVCFDPSYCPPGAESLADADACRGPGDVDNDGDGWTVADGDCNDDDPSIRPGEHERPGDGVDNDCDGEVDEIE